eukprot:10279534-Alexandrium_andersonii.AAC.1
MLTSTASHSLRDKCVSLVCFTRDDVLPDTQGAEPDALGNAAPLSGNDKHHLLGAVRALG